MTDIGARNIEFVRHYLSMEACASNAQDVGGDQPRKVVYFPNEGKVRVRKLRPIENRGISDREKALPRQPARQGCRRRYRAIHLSCTA